MLSRTQYFQHRFDTFAILGNAGTANFHFHYRVAALKIAFHFLLEFVQALAGVVVAASGIYKNARIGCAVAIALSQQLEQRFAFDLCDCIPDGHVYGADRNRSLTVTAGLFIGHYAGPDFVGIQVLAARVNQCGRISFENAGDETIAHQGTLPITTIGVESVANDRLAIADHVRYHRHKTEGHLGEVNVGVTNVGLDRTC